MVCQSLVNWRGVSVAETLICTKSPGWAGWLDGLVAIGINAVRSPMIPVELIDSLLPWDWTHGVNGWAESVVCVREERNRATGILFLETNRQNIKNINPVEIDISNEYFQGSVTILPLCQCACSGEGASGHTDGSTDRNPDRNRSCSHIQLCNRH